MTTTDATSTNSTLNAYLQQQAQNVAADQTAASSSTSSATSALASNQATSIGSNFNTFIKILTTQLQSQDPTNATDPNQFTQELVQFAGVEQQLNTNNDLQTLISLQKNSSGSVAALNYIGGYVEVPSTGSLALQNGSAQVGYTLPTAASSSTITVKNASGQTVATLSGGTKTGLNYVSWDGKDDNGNQLADGTYTFTVTANDSSTQAAESITDVRVLGKVTGVTTNTDGTTNLSLGNGLSVSTSKVDAVYSSGNLPTATAA